MEGMFLGQVLRDSLFAEAISRGLQEDCPFFLAGMRRSPSNVSDEFNDMLFAVSRNQGLFGMVGTTKPGIYATANPVTYKGVTGAGWLKPGFYKDVYQLGIHGSSNRAFAHEAFIQVGTFKFYRDINKDGDIDDYEPEQSALDTGFNFHRASKVRDEQKIGLYSYGCQVVKNCDAHEYVVGMFKKDMPTGSKVSYMLLDEADTKRMGIIV